MKRSQLMLQLLPQAASGAGWLLLWRCVCLKKRPENILPLWKNGFKKGHLIHLRDSS